jgi:HEPN domain-containing protein
MNDNQLVQEWLERANDDELNARSIFNHKDGTENAVCFLCQQSTEKLLKALLIFKNTEPPKVHDLLKLASLLEKSGVVLSELIDDLTNLDKFYISTRYPGEYEKYSWVDAQNALASLEKIKKLVENSISNEKQVPQN